MTRPHAIRRVLSEARAQSIAGASLAGVIAGGFVIFATLFSLWRI